MGPYNGPKRSAKPTGTGNNGQASSSGHRNGRGSLSRQLQNGGRINFSNGASSSQSSSSGLTNHRETTGRGHSSNFNSNKSNRTHGFDNGTNKSDRPTRTLGFKLLADLVEKPVDETVMSLDHHSKDFLFTIAQPENLQDDVMYLLIQIIGEKLCAETSLHEIQNRLVAAICEVPFLNKIVSFSLQQLLDVAQPLSKQPRHDLIPVDRSSLRIIEASYLFYTFVNAKMPNVAADGLRKNIMAGIKVIQMLKLSKEIPDNEMVQQLEQRYTNLLASIDEFHISREKSAASNEKSRPIRNWKMTDADVERLYMQEPDDDFTKINIVPSSEEILSEDEPFLRPNLIKGKYPNSRTYLDVQFRLLREDFVAPLRESVQEYMSNEPAYSNRKKKLPPGTIRFYSDLKLVKVQCMAETTIYLMQFAMTHNLTRVKWDKSKRLLNGSLLLLTPDKFRTIYFATVARRDERELQRGIIGIIWEGERPPDLYGDFKFLMVECEVYFESYRHTLKALQSMMKLAPPHYEEPLFQKYRMAKYIVDMTTEKVPPPSYLSGLNLRLNFQMLLVCNAEEIKQRVDQEVKKSESTPSASMESLSIETIEDDETGIDEMIELRPHECSPLDFAKWPTAHDFGMDDSQYLAFRSAISQELSIIQGPPGTGKTFIGLQIVKLLLSNSKIIWGQPGQLDASSTLSETLPYLSPILIVCYTNHALDQFLEGIISIMRSLGMQPQENLIRVGGRSKVDVVADLGIHKRREHYRKHRKYDHSFVSARREAYERLKQLQSFRSDLKDEFKCLRNPEGIVDFRGMGSFAKDYEDRRCSYDFVQQLKQVLPESLHPFVFVFSRFSSLVTWLGLHSPEFRYKDFDVQRALKSWFRLHRFPPAKFAVVKTLEKQENTVEDRDDEDYDMAELMANRLDEEIVYEIDLNKRRQIKLSYLLGPDIGFNIRNRREMLHQQYNQPDASNRMKENILSQLYNLDLEEIFYTNQINFVIEVLRAYQEGRIELPVVTPDLLQRGHEQAAPLKPSFSEKWAIYFYVIQQAKKIISEKINNVECSIFKAQTAFSEINTQGDGIILRETKVVGLTTTGAAKYAELLRMMKSRIVIIEEAAEVLESAVVTSITEHCEHLILIGDHQQLRPSTTVYKLAKDYNLEISLFERLINNNMNWQYLKAQHRMRPSICKLLVPTIYKHLDNHPVVQEYPNVTGLAKNLFFITHTELEKADNDSMTKSNEYEARFLTKLCRHLLLQGTYQPSQITILTTYIGQMFLIKKIISNNERICQGVRVTVVDNFQGEENDIILLSLVRSNENNRIGFLKTDNRICVALSRAKHGLYIIGNMECLLNSKSDTWKKISDELTEQENIGEQLELKCQNHGDIIKVQSPDDFQQSSPEGGCLNRCAGVLPYCDHACRLICHIKDREHKEYRCKFPCEKKCQENHPCPYECGVRPCPACLEPMERNLPCGHVKTLQCYICIKTYRCMEIVQKKLPCSHEKALHCHVPAETYVCQEKVEKTLTCSHKKHLPCPKPVSEWVCIEDVDKILKCGHLHRMKCSDDPTSITCTVPTLKQLACTHEQEVSCSLDAVDALCTTLLEMKMPGCHHNVNVQCHNSGRPESWKCQSKCDTRLECGHQCTQKCHLDNDPEHLRYKCQKNCARSCVENHPCGKRHKCYQPCDPCKVKIEKTLQCEHKIKLPCHTNTDDVTCQMPCLKVVPCPFKHPCLKKCFEDCSPCKTVISKTSIDCEHSVEVQCSAMAQRSICEKPVVAAVKSFCGHSVEVPCRIQQTVKAEDLLEYCHQPCGHNFSEEAGGCTHVCQGDCSSCFQGRMHLKCAEKCERTLPCGHICKFPCSKLCPPCEDKCQQSCEHSKCKKKCGMICTGCKEDCSWSCEHKKCTKRCDQVCDRDACDKFCKKLLECGHECIGMCGDPCPPFCRICDKEVVQDIFFGTEDEEGSRFVYLEDCKHIIEINGMNTWMTQDQEKGKIDAKRCPRCRQVIMKSARYGKILKENVRNLVDVQTKIFYHTKREQLIKAQNRMIGVVIHPDQNYYFDSFRKKLFDILCTVKLLPTKKGGSIPQFIPNKVDQYVMESVDNMITWWREAEKNVKRKPANPVPVRPQRRIETTRFGHRYPQFVPVAPVLQPVKQDLTEECHNDLVSKYTNLLKIVYDRKLPLSQREVLDFDREFDRLNDLYRLYRRRGIDSFDSYHGALLLFNTARDHLKMPKLYNEGMKRSFSQQLENLGSVLKAGWVQLEKETRERGDIFRAMGMTANHWYRCRNGHLYTVGDCGALNQSSVCPACRSQIGGGSGNTHFTNLDENVIRQQTSSLVVVPALPAFVSDGAVETRRTGPRLGN